MGLWCRFVSFLKQIGTRGQVKLNELRSPRSVAPQAQKTKQHNKLRFAKGKLSAFSEYIPFLIFCLLMGVIVYEMWYWMYYDVVEFRKKIPKIPT
jgi:hypothetical protein